MKKRDKNRILYDLEARHGARGVKMNKYEGKKILALDFGEKFCGTAFSFDGVSTLPLTVFDTHDFEVEIKKLIKEKNPDFWVVGLPLSSDKSENKICKKIRKIKKNILEEKFQQKVKLVNERCSSRNFYDLDGRIDDLAAQKILEFFLEQK